jgi:transposase
MRTRDFHLTAAAIQELDHAAQTTKRADELRRFQAVRLYGTGVELATIQTLTHLSKRSIQRWVSDYKEGGVVSLKRQKPGGNNRKLTAAQRTEIQAKLHQYRPVDLHISQGQWWTVSDLRVVVERWFGVVYKDADSYQSLLHASGFSYQRTTKVYRSQPSQIVRADFEAQLEKK